MGAYITKTDIIEQLPLESLIQLTDDDGIGVVNDARVDAAIADAEGEADGYLSTAYTVPLSPVSGVVKKFCVDIAIYNLFSRRDAMPPEREKRYENAVKFFSNAAKGLVSLGANAPEPSSSTFTTDIESSERTFSRDKMEGF